MRNFLLLFFYPFSQKSNNTLIREEKTLKEYIWTSNTSSRNMEVHFTCNNNNQMNIIIKDPAQMDFVKGYPAYIKMSVEYSPILGSENDIRLTHRGGMFLEEAKILKIERKYIQQFLENLRTLHLKDIENKKMIREEYDRAISHCETRKGKRKNICYRTLTTGAYMVSNHPSVSLDIISNVLPPKNARPIQFLAGFNSEQLFENLKKISCYQDINE